MLTRKPNEGNPDLCTQPVLSLVFCFLFVGAIFPIFESRASADSIPEQDLQIEKEACSKECVTKGLSNSTCEAFCTCYAQQLGKHLSYLEYQEASTSMRDGSPPVPADIKTKITASEEACFP